MPKHIKREKFEKIKTLKEIGLQQQKIAEWENVSSGTVSKIVNSKTWEEFRGIKPTTAQKGLFESQEVLELLNEMKAMLEKLLEREKCL